MREKELDWMHTLIPKLQGCNSEGAPDLPKKHLNPPEMYAHLTVTKFITDLQYKSSFWSCIKNRMVTSVTFFLDDILIQKDFAWQYTGHPSTLYIYTVL